MLTLFHYVSRVSLLTFLIGPLATGRCFVFQMDLFYLKSQLLDSDWEILYDNFCILLLKQFFEAISMEGAR